MDPRATKLKMLAELKEYGLGALKKRVMGGLDGEDMSPEGRESSLPVPGVEEMTEETSGEMPMADDAGMSGEMDEEELMRLLEEAAAKEA
jgi:hypothetical protein